MTRKDLILPAALSLADLLLDEPTTMRDGTRRMIIHVIQRKLSEMAHDTDKDDTTTATTEGIYRGQ